MIKASPTGQLYQRQQSVSPGGVRNGEKEGFKLVIPAAWARETGMSYDSRPWVIAVSGLLAIIPDGADDEKVKAIRNILMFVEEHGVDALDLALQEFSLKERKKQIEESHKAKSSVQAEAAPTVG